MSEKQSNIINSELPEDLEHFESLDMMKYANGAQHAYGIDSEGKRYHISNDDILRAYGYDPADRPTDDESSPDSVDGSIDVLDPRDIDTPEDDLGEQGRTAPEVEITSLETRLTLAEHEYAKRTAKARKSYLGRFCQGKTRIGRTLMKVPGVGSAIEAVNTKFDTKTLEAKEEYEKLFNKLGVKAVEELRAMGYSEDKVISLAASGVILRNQRLNQMILSERKMQSKDTNKFVNWWVNAKGIKGKLTKVAVVASAGLLAGATAGAVLPAFSGLIAGGAAGGGIARHVTRRRANATDKSGRTLASRQAGADRDASYKFVFENFDRGEFSRVEDITDRVEYRTDNEMLGNRRRMKSAVAVGKLAGGASFIRDVGENLHQRFFEDGKPKSAGSDTDTLGGGSDSAGGVEADGPLTNRPSGDTVHADGPLTEPAPNIDTGADILKGNEFAVESGHGFTHEWMDWAKANGKTLSAEESYELHKAVRDRFGDNGIIKNLNTYNEGGDLRIASPGNAQWNDGVADFAKSWMQKRGKW